jgi:hypothetical protein
LVPTRPPATIHVYAELGINTNRGRPPKKSNISDDDVRDAYASSIKQINRRNFRQGLLALIQHYGIRGDDIEPNFTALINERNEIAHRGKAAALTFNLIILVREFVTRILLSEIHYEGPYECYIGGRHARNFPDCKRQV